MENKNLGEQGRELLEDIVSGDFSQLNEKVKNFSQCAIDEFNQATSDIRMKAQPTFEEGKKQVIESVMTAKKSLLKATKQSQNTTHDAKKGNVVQQSNHQESRYPVVDLKPNLMEVKRRHAGKASIALGTGGLSLSLAAAITLGCVWIGTGCHFEVLKVLTIVFGGLSLLNVGLIRKGLRKRRFYHRYESYYHMLEKDGFCEIKAMAGRLGYSRRAVIKDLRKMIAKGMFLEGHFDEKKILFIGNDEVFQQYMDARKGYEERLWKEKMDQYKEREAAPSTEEPEMSDELAKALKDGQMVLEQLNRTKQGISNKLVVDKIDNLELLVAKIFACVEKHPEKLPEIHKFMEYYLPITAKLVNAYKEFEAQPIQGENISKSKKEIEDTLDTIIVAFENLLDSLYEGEAMEVSSDISVLHALFAQEGLTKKDFDI